MSDVPSRPEREGPIPPGLLAQADQLQASQAEHGEAINAFMANVLASITPEDEERLDPDLPWS